MTFAHPHRKMKTKFKKNMTLKLAVSTAIFASFSFPSQNSYAFGQLTFTELAAVDTSRGPVNIVAEPTTGNTQFVNAGVTFTLLNPDNWAAFDLGCNINGSVSITEPNVSGAVATRGSDYLVPSDLTFSATINAADAAGSSVSVDIPFEVLSDFDTEEDESFGVDIIEVQAVCTGTDGDGTVFSEDRTGDVQVSTGYGYGTDITISDTFNDGAEEPVVDNTVDVFPNEQTSLITQVQDITNLSIHTGLLQSRRLGTELENLRKGKRGLNVNNLQVKVNDVHLPIGEWRYKNDVKGAGAGDPLAGFGRWGAFVSGSIEFGEQKNNGDNEYDSSIILIGADYQFSSNLVVGAALGYTSLESEAGNNIVTTEFTKTSYYTFFSYYEDNLYVDGILGYGDVDYDLSRTVVSDTLNAATGGDEINVSFGLGYQFDLKRSNINLRGLVNYVDAGVDAYSEQSDGVELTANVDNFSKKSFVSNIGAEYSFNINTSFGVFVPQFTLGWEHQFDGEAVTVSGNFVGESASQDFAFQTNRLDQSYFTAQIGLTATFTHGISAYITYDTYGERDDLSSELYAFGIRGQF